MSNNLPSAPHIVEAPSPETSDLPSVDAFRQLFETHGALLFRGFAASREDFVRFSSHYSLPNWVQYMFGGRDSVSAKDSLQTVNTGSSAIPAHAELAHVPVQPHTGWLYCETPPARLGGTTLYDGVRIVEKMPAEVRALLSDRSFRYRRRYPLSMALRLFDVADREALAGLLERMGLSDSIRIEGDMVVQDYLVPAIPVHEASGKPVFANMLVHNSRMRPFYASTHEYLTRNRWVRPLLRLFVSLFDRLPARFSRVPHPRGVALYPTLDDGRVVHRSMIEALLGVYEEVETAVSWQAGDILVFDNTRFMHGRQPVVDDRRMILTRFGFPSWAPPLHIRVREGIPAAQIASA